MRYGSEMPENRKGIFLLKRVDERMYSTKYAEEIVNSARAHGLPFQIAVLQGGPKPGTLCFVRLHFIKY